MQIERTPPISAQQPVQGINNPASDEQKVVSQDTGLPVVSRQNESSKSESHNQNQEWTRQDVENLTKRMNLVMSLIRTRFKFIVHSKSGIANIQVKVIDQDTGKVLAVIPPKRLADLLDTFRDSSGMIVDEEA